MIYRIHDRDTNVSAVSWYRKLKATVTLGNNDIRPRIEKTEEFTDPIYIRYYAGGNMVQVAITFSIFPGLLSRAD